VYSDKVKSWSAFGGPDRAIRRYGTTLPDGAAKMIHEKVLPSTRWRFMRKKNSAADVIAAVATDTDGIGFVETTEARAVGGKVKILGLTDENETTVRPNAETVKNGSYPLSETLVLYVSSQAGPMGKSFATFLRSDKCGAVYRKHGFVPGVQAVRQEMAAMFESLYGESIRKAEATKDPADDVQLAGQLLDAARTMKENPDLFQLLCETAYKLGSGSVEGEETALAAMEQLADTMPQTAFDAATKIAAILAGRYEREKTPGCGEQWVDGLLAATKIATEHQQHAEAAQTCEQALAAAKEIASPRHATIAAELKLLRAREKVMEEVQELQTKLSNAEKNPTGVSKEAVEGNVKKMRNRMVWLQVAELNDPTGAAKHLGEGCDETFFTNIPLVNAEPETLSAEAAIKLAEWYVSLTDQVSPAGLDLMRNRAKTYYQRFLTVHETKDALAIRAELGVKKLGLSTEEQYLMKHCAELAREGKELPKTVALTVPKTMTDAELVSFIGRNLDLQSLKMAGCRSITDLSQLPRLRKLTSLEISHCPGVKDLKPLATMRSLRQFRLLNCPEISDLSPLAALPKLTNLSLARCKNIDTLSSLVGLKTITSLSLNHCEKITNLSPVSRLVNLTRLDVVGCKELSDVSSLARLRKLEKLTIKDCPKIAPPQLAALEQALPDCTLATGQPKKDKKAANKKKDD
jgi:hypothetical protein